MQIFSRMNSTGYKLNPQELRNAEWFGEFKAVAYELATEQLERWRRWNVFDSDQIARISEVELVSEFLMLIFHGTFEKGLRGSTPSTRSMTNDLPLSFSSTEI